MSFLFLDEYTSEVYSSVGPGTYRWYLHGDFSTSNKMCTNDIEKATTNKEKEVLETKGKFFYHYFYLYEKLRLNYFR